MLESNPVMVVIIAVAIFLVVAGLAYLIRIRGLRKAAENTFACPNCGRRFTAKRHQLFNSYRLAVTENKALLKCPECNKRDICSIPYDMANTV